jgi:hypothetical protein
VGNFFSRTLFGSLSDVVHSDDFSSDCCSAKAEKPILKDLTGYVKAGVHRDGPTMNVPYKTTGALVGFGPTWLGHLDVSLHLG